MRFIGRGQRRAHRVVARPAGRMHVRQVDRKHHSVFQLLERPRFALAWIAILLSKRLTCARSKSLMTHPVASLHDRFPFSVDTSRYPIIWDAGADRFRTIAPAIQTLNPNIIWKVSRWIDELRP